MEAIKPDITPEGFFDVDIRAGEIVDVQAFPRARKPAWKVCVDFGGEIGEKWTSAQITNYGPDELLGRTVVGVLNLGERNIAGFSSQFLLLGAIQPDGAVHLLGVPDGSAIGAAVA